MRKPIAILLLSLHLFSLFACFAVYAFAVYQSDRFFEKQTSLGLYNTSDLSEVKIPMDIPGIADWKAYENIHGEVRFAHSAYNYVKIKITSKAIYLLCIPNYRSTRLCGQNIIDARKIPDIPVSKKDHVPAEKFFHLSTFNTCSVYYRFLIPVKPVHSSSVAGNIQVVNSPITNPGQPPETC